MTASQADRQIFLNIPVTSLDASVDFYTSLGFARNAAFSDASTTCIVISPAISVMLHLHPRYTSFLPPDKTIPDARKTAQILMCFTCESKAEVDQLVEKAAKAGGRADPGPKQEMGDMMYGRSFEDLDGHIWEVSWMDKAFAGSQEKKAE